MRSPARRPRPPRAWRRLRPPSSASRSSATARSTLGRQGQSRPPPQAPATHSSFTASLRKSREHLLDVLDEADGRLLDLVEVAASELRRRAGGVAPHAGAARTRQRPAAGEEVRRHHRRRRLDRERRVLAHGLAQVDERLVDGHHGRCLADVRVQAGLGAQVGLELVRRERVPVVERERDRALREVVADLHDRGRERDHVRVVAVDEDDLAEAAFGQRADDVLHQAHHRLRRDERHAGVAEVVARDAVAERRRDQRVDAPREADADLGREHPVGPERRV